MDKIRIYIALLFCQAISFILPVQAQDNTGSDSNWYNPYGGLMANSTNHNQQRYKYNGKELDRMHGLDWYDYGNPIMFKEFRISDPIHPECLLDPLCT